MPKLLSPDQVAHYHEKGYLSPLTAFDTAAARSYLGKLEELEAQVGRKFAENDEAKKMHLYLKWVDDIVHSPAVLDAVEDVIGPDIRLYNLRCWIKEPQTHSFISWHQDSLNFGLSPHEHVTAWIALSDSDLESGAVQVIPGSQKRGMLRHRPTPGTENMLSRGQEIEVGENEPTDMMVLKAGQFSLHHTNLVHSSMSNNSSHRRIGLGVSFIPAHVKCGSRTRLSAMLVRGTDRYGYYEDEPRPAYDLEPAAVARRCVVRSFGTDGVIN